MNFMSAIEDLRFTIGVFFLIVSVILVIAGLVPLPAADIPAGARGVGINLNLWVGCGLGAFGALMVGLWASDRTPR